MALTFDNIKRTTEFINSKINNTPRQGIILGTGLGKLVGRIENRVEIPYNEIPDFPVSTVESHAGKLITGTLCGKHIAAMQGRFHYYEGYSMEQIAFPVRVMKLLGIDTLIVSNAAGGINPLLSPGSLMAITDHINLLGTNPLIGPNDNRTGPRFPDMSQPYSEELLQIVMNTASDKKIRIERGIYASMSGPCLETKAEYRMLKTLGADAVGMSTVPEVIAAVHAGIRVLGLSVITDSCLPDALEPVDIKDIIAAAGSAEPSLVTLIEETLKKL